MRKCMRENLTRMDLATMPTYIRLTATQNDVPKEDILEGKCLAS